MLGGQHAGAGAHAGDAARRRSALDFERVAGTAFEFGLPARTLTEAKGIRLLTEVRGAKRGPELANIGRGASAMAMVEGGSHPALVPEQLALGIRGGGTQALRGRGIEPEGLAMGRIAKIEALGLVTTAVVDGVGAGGHRHGFQRFGLGEHARLGGKDSSDVVLERNADDALTAHFDSHRSLAPKVAFKGFTSERRRIDRTPTMRREDDHYDLRLRGGCKAGEPGVRSGAGLAEHLERRGLRALAGAKVGRSLHAGPDGVVLRIPPRPQQRQLPVGLREFDGSAGDAPLADAFEHQLVQVGRGSRVEAELPQSGGQFRGIETPRGLGEVRVAGVGERGRKIDGRGQLGVRAVELTAGDAHLPAAGEGSIGMECRRLEQRDGGERLEGGLGADPHGLDVARLDDAAGGYIDDDQRGSEQQHTRMIRESRQAIRARPGSRL